MALVAVILCVQSAGVRAQGVDFDLLIQSLKEKARPSGTLRPEWSPTGRGRERFANPPQDSKPAQKLDPIQELTEYVQCLKQARCRPLLDQTGEEAARNLGYSRLFAGAYDEALQRYRVRQREKEQANFADFTADFEAIAKEEQTIEQLLAARERHAAAIAYLRAMQNGDVAFPAPQTLAPIPPLALLQLMTIYEGTVFDLDDPVFAAIYRETRNWTVSRIKSAADLSAAEVIGVFRGLVIQSAVGPDTPNACDKGAAIGAATVVAEFCPKLVVGQQATSTSDAVKPDGSGMECKLKSAADTRSKLSALPAAEINNLCEQLAQQVQSGKIPALNVAR
jgi:hypothetical protein